MAYYVNQLTVVMSTTVSIELTCKNIDQNALAYRVANSKNQFTIIV